MSSSAVGGFGGGISNLTGSAYIGGDGGSAKAFVTASGAKSVTGTAVAVGGSGGAGNGGVGVGGDATAQSSASSSGGPVSSSASAASGQAGFNPNVDLTTSSTATATATAVASGSDPSATANSQATALSGLTGISIATAQAATAFGQTATAIASGQGLGGLTTAVASTKYAGASVTATTWAPSTVSQTNVVSMVSGGGPPPSVTQGLFTTAGISNAYATGTVLPDPVASAAAIASSPTLAASLSGLNLTYLGAGTQGALQGFSETAQHEFVSQLTFSLDPSTLTDDIGLVFIDQLFINNGFDKLTFSTNEAISNGMVLVTLTFDMLASGPGDGFAISELLVDPPTSDLLPLGPNSTLTFNSLADAQNFFGPNAYDLGNPSDFPTVTATPLPSTWTMMLIGLAGFGFFAFRGSKKASAVLAAA